MGDTREHHSHNGDPNAGGSAWRPVTDPGTTPVPSARVGFPWAYALRCRTRGYAAVVDPPRRLWNHSGNGIFAECWLLSNLADRFRLN